MSWEEVCHFIAQAAINVSEGHTETVILLLIALGTVVGLIGAGAATARYVRVGDGRAATMTGRVRQRFARRRVQTTLRQEDTAHTQRV